MLIKEPIIIGSNALKKSTRAVSDIEAELNKENPEFETAPELVEILREPTEDELREEATAKIIKEGGPLIGTLLNIRV